MAASGSRVQRAAPLEVHVAGRGPVLQQRPQQRQVACLGGGVQRRSPASVAGGDVRVEGQQQPRGLLPALGGTTCLTLLV